MSRLIITLDENKVDEVDVKNGDISIGRNKDNDICLNDSAVSAHHAKIVTVFDPSFMDSTLIEDQGSTNGTYINEHRVEEQILCDGDVITIGKYQLLFEFNNDDSVTVETEQTRILNPTEIEQLLKSASGEKIREIADHNLIPEEVKWVAQDEEGMWWGFSKKPVKDGHGWKTDASEPMHELLQSSISEDWKHSLRRL